jgi:hypothetical protein
MNGGRVALPKGKVAWRNNQAFALGHALARGQDVGYRVDLIILSEEEPVGIRVEELIADAAASGLRPALMLLDSQWLKDAKLPEGIPVYAIPPDDESQQKALEEKIENIFLGRRPYLLWAVGPNSDGPIGFKHE